MAFASTGGDFNIEPGNNIRFLKLHGQIYHRASSLHPADGDHPQFAQLYMVDSDIALSERLDQLNHILPSQSINQLTVLEKRDMKEVLKELKSMYFER